MSKFTKVESDRVLMLLTEAVEKLTLLAKIPSIDLINNNNQKEFQILLLNELSEEPAFVLKTLVCIYLILRDLPSFLMIYLCSFMANKNSYEFHKGVLMIYATIKSQVLI